MNILNGLSEFISQTGVQCRKYWEQQNAKTQAELRQQEISSKLMQAENCFPTVLEIYHQALKNTAEVIGAHIPHHKYQCASTPYISMESSGLVVYRFRFYKKSYDFDSDFASRILFCELNHITSAYGFPALQPCVTVESDGRVLVRLAWKSDCERLTNNAKR